jgi:hypothetical protein
MRRGTLKPDLVMTIGGDARGVDLSQAPGWRLIGRRDGVPLFVDLAPRFAMPDPRVKGRATLTHTWLPGETAEIGWMTVEAQAVWPGLRPQRFAVCAVEVTDD